MRKFARVVVLGLVCALSPRGADAAVITLEAISGLGTFTPGGTLGSDEDVALLSFTVLEDGTLFTARTTSFAQGGFDPYLALFTAAGFIHTYEDPADPGAIYPALSVDLDTENGDWDDVLSLSLAAGSYTLAVLQYGNELLSDQLIEVSGTPGFTLGDSPPPGCSAFLGFDGVCRTGEFGLNVGLTSAAPPPAPVPEPATLTLFGIGAAGAMLRKTVRRRRTPSSH